MLANEMAKGHTPEGIRGQIHMHSKRIIYWLMGFALERTPNRENRVEQTSRSGPLILRGS